MTPWRKLRLTVLWLGSAVIVGGLGLLVADRFLAPDLNPDRTTGFAMIVAGLVAIVLVVPMESAPSPLLPSARRYVLAIPLAAIMLGLGVLSGGLLAISGNPVPWSFPYSDWQHSVFQICLGFVIIGCGAGILTSVLSQLPDR